MIGVVVREMPYLKVLAPIMRELINAGQNYNLYYMDSPKGDKEYARPTLLKLKASNPEIVKNARAFKDDKQLRQLLAQDKITKMISIEIYLWAKSYPQFFKSNNIKTYSLLYLTDSLWQPDPQSVLFADKTYYSTKFLMDTHLDFVGVKYNPNRDMCIGSPIFDHLQNSIGDRVLVLMPNLKNEHVSMSFGNAQNFIKIIENIRSQVDKPLIFKTRKKQWMPKEISQYGEIVDDGNIMYPPRISDLFKQSHTVVMFYSSGVYEAIYSNNYVVNIPIPLKRWSWDKHKMEHYFNSSLYNSPGIVESVNQKNILNGTWNMSNKLDPDAKSQWLNKFVGQISKNSVKYIVSDIVL